MLRHYVVRALVTYYAELAGYRGPIMVTLRRDTFERERIRRKYQGPADEEHDFGATLTSAGAHSAPLVWVNPTKNLGTATLTRTCAHEAVHVAFPEFPHGPAFERRVGRIRRGERL